MTAADRFHVSMDELERSAHVPVAEQVTEQAEPPPQGPIVDEELDRQRLLGVTAAGRLRLR